MIKNIVSPVLKVLILIILFPCCNLGSGVFNFERIKYSEIYCCDLIKGGEEGMLYVQDNGKAIVTWSDGTFMYGRVEEASQDLQRVTNINGLQTVRKWRYCKSNGEVSIEYWFGCNCILHNLSKFENGQVIYNSGPIISF